MDARACSSPSGRGTSSTSPRSRWPPLLALIAGTAWVIQLGVGWLYHLYRGRFTYGTFEEVRALSMRRRRGRCAPRGAGGHPRPRGRHPAQHGLPRDADRSAVHVQRALPQAAVRRAQGPTVRRCGADPRVRCRLPRVVDCSSHDHRRRSGLSPGRPARRRSGRRRTHRCEARAYSARSATCPRSSKRPEPRCWSWRSLEPTPN